MKSPAVLESIPTSTGESLSAYLQRRRALVLFLRHSGCTFCREALADIALHRRAVEEEGTSIVIVHMMTLERGAAFLARYGLSDLCHVSDPKRIVYAAFDVARGSLRQLIAPAVFLRGLEATLNGHGVGAAEGDPFQMPGLLLVQGGEIIDRFEFRTAADRPNYLEFARRALEKKSA